MVRLEKMAAEDFDTYIEKLTANYAKDNVRSGRWTREEALEKSVSQINSLLPEGIETQNHVFFSIVDEGTGDVVGYIWLHVVPGEGPKKAFIYDLIIFEKFRKRGYGRAALVALEEYAKEKRIASISLHVFAHNAAALSLYRKMGYEVTSMNMKKNISDTQME
ncbi:MAG TPA: GNAT family N-acetyltransferase [Mesotoga infera]|jgi:ribosomal protein S18 acetylase RimI-like enzyme|nr:GNAT family N-acetyltransferase [Thermotogaceae bacterium]HNR80469.1 GNAT family N-acetyltransferase [Mesotoga infera]HOI35341.1 GNAT family N-acetyltransferase [Mesotoga infera]